MKPSKILSIATQYDRLIKRAFTEAPPVLLEKLYNIYKEIYLEYVNKLKNNFKLLRLEQIKINKQKIFNKENSLIWREWFKNAPDEDDFSKYFLKNKLLPQFLYFIEQKESNKFTFNQVLPTKYQPPKELDIGGGMFLFNFNIFKLNDDFDVNSDLDKNNEKNFLINLEIKISGFPESNYETVKVINKNISFNEIILKIKDPPDILHLKYTLDFLDKITTLNITEYHPELDLNVNEGLGKIYKSNNDSILNYYTADMPYIVKKEDLYGWQWFNIIPKKYYSNIFIDLNFTVGPSVIDEQFKSKHYGFQHYESGGHTISIGIEKFKYEDFKNQEILSKKIQNDLKKIKKTINHELIHVFQSFQDGKYKFGFPPKIKEKSEHDLMGKNQSGKRTQEHQFRLIEVYPRIGDSILRFKDEIIKIPKETQSQFIRDFIGMNGIKENTDYNFEKVLKTIKTPYDERVYQNMVKQFLAEIARLGYEP